MDRVAMIRGMLEQRPDEPFLRYGLAMELDKRGEHEAAVEAFSQLLGQHPDYVAGYLMFGNLLARLGRRPEAIEVYDRGIAAARRAGNDHAEGELVTARAELD